MNQPPLNPDAKRKCVDMLLAYSGTPRDRLYEYPHRSDDSDRYISNAESLLDQILAAVLPEVTNVEALHQLPSGSIVRASGGSAWKKFGSGWGAWFKAGDSLDYEASIVALPARVLYLPELKS